MATRNRTAAARERGAAPATPETDQHARGERVGAAYHYLREHIVHGRLAPGSRIMESDITQRLGVSRTPVRSALHRLQQEGYIVAQEQGRETRLVVAPLTQEDARELLQIVGEIEGLGARWAATLPSRPRAALVQRLRELNTDLARASRERQNANRIFDLDALFHRTYVEAGAGPRLLALHDMYKPQTERYIRLYVSALTDEIDKSVAEHEATIRQIHKGNPDEAQRAVQVNWRNAADRMARVVDQLGERGSW